MSINVVHNLIELAIVYVSELWHAYLVVQQHMFLIVEKGSLIMITPCHALMEFRKFVSLRYRHEPIRINIDTKSLLFVSCP